MKKEVIPAAAVISVLLVTAVSAALSGLEFCQIEAKADTQSSYPVGNPVTLFEVPNDEVQGEFGVGVFNEELEPKADFQVGEEVNLVLMVRWFRGGTFPLIANLTTISISNETGNIILSEVVGPIGGGWTAGTSGGQGEVVYWVPDVVGNYSAGVKFEGLIYEASEDYSNIIPFRVHKPGSFVGKVTEADETTAISDALVEALVDGVVKANATTDEEGAYNLALDKAGVYDVRVSAPGYVAVIQRGVSTELESKWLNFSLASTTLSPNFSILWSTNAGNSRNVVVDSHGNIIIASESEVGFTVVSKFDPSGNLLWNISKSFSGAWEAPSGLAVDSSDNILLLVAPNQIWCYDLWTVKLDPYGNHMWMKSFDTNETDQGTSIAVDSFDNVIIIGSVHGNLTSTLVKYTSNGGLIWSKTLPIYFETGEMVVDSNNNIVLGGSTCSVSTGMDYYAAKLDSQGNLLWERMFNTNNSECCGYGVSLDSNENIILIGDKFIVKLGPGGNEIWLKYFSGKDLVVDLADNIFSIRKSFVEMFDRNGLLLGNIDLTETLHTIAFDRNGSLIVGGAKNVVKIGLGGNSTTQSEDPASQLKTPTNSDPNSSSPKNASASISLEPTPMSTPEPPVLPPSSPESVPATSQGSLIPEAQQTSETKPVLVFAPIISLVSVSTVLLVYFKKRKH